MIYVNACGLGEGEGEGEGGLLYKKNVSRSSSIKALFTSERIIAICEYEIIQCLRNIMGSGSYFPFGASS